MRATALWGSVLLHRTWERSLADLAGALPGSGTGARQSLVRWYVRWFVPATAVHARVEDTVLWPALLARRPSAVSATDVMTRQHDLVDAAIRHLHAALPTGDAATVRTFVAGLATAVERHVDFEEQVAFPMLESEFRPDELGDLLREAVHALTAEELATVVPFALAHATDDELERVLGAMPPALALQYDWQWRDRYAADAAALRPDDPASDQSSSPPDWPRFQ